MPPTETPSVATKVTAAKAAKILETSPHEVAEMASEGLLGTTETDGTGRLMVDKAKVDELAAARTGKSR